MFPIPKTINRKSLKIKTLREGGSPARTDVELLCRKAVQYGRRLTTLNYI